MKHIVVTKFNLPDGTGRHLDEAWLEDRFDLFERWALPSMIAQSADDFDWLVHCWHSTPERYKKKMSEYTKTYHQFTAVYLDGKDWPEIWGNWMSVIRDHAEKGVNLTTRIDSDDAVRYDYLECMREIAEPGIWTAFHFGLMHKDNQVYLRKYNRNPFLTYSEDIKNIDDIETVNKFTHPRVPNIKYYPDTRPGWVQNAHENTGWNKYTLLPENMIGNWFSFDGAKKEFGL